MAAINKRCLAIDRLQMSLIRPSSLCTDRSGVARTYACLGPDFIRYGSGLLPRHDNYALFTRLEISSFEIRSAFINRRVPGYPAFIGFQDLASTRLGASTPKSGIQGAKMQKYEFIG